MHNPGLAESHPSVLRGNRLLICISGSGFISKFEGVMYCACLDKTINLLETGLRTDGFLFIIWTADFIGNNKANCNKA